MGPVDSAADKARVPDEWTARDESFQTTDRRPLDGRNASTAPDNLRQRIDGLPPGHPSSPYDADGTRRQPISLSDLETPNEDEPGDNDWQELDAREGVYGRANLETPATDRDSAPNPDAKRDVDADPMVDPTRPTDKPGPLTDAEWKEHVTEVRDNLEAANEAGLATDRRYTVDKARGIWTDERDLIHDSIIEAIYNRAYAVPCEGKAIVAGGLSGAGKTTTLDKHAGIDRSQYLTINPDNIKEEMASRGLIPEVEGLSPMEASDLAHEESSAVAKRLARKALSDGKNVIWDITMSTRKSVENRVSDLREAGYAVDGIFIDIPVAVSIRRSDARHREGHDDYRAGIGLGGRYVPPEVIEAQVDPDWGSKNRKTFEEVNHRFDHWSRYDNSVDGRQAMLVQTDKADDTNPWETD